jgi:hypothetical protein
MPAEEQVDAVPAVMEVFRIAVAVAVAVIMAPPVTVFVRTSIVAESVAPPVTVSMVAPMVSVPVPTIAIVVPMPAVIPTAVDVMMTMRC